MYEYDELQMYKGYDIPITKDIVVTQPTLNQIVDFGEKKYFSSVRILTSVAADFKWQLWEMNQTDYTKVDDYDLFVNYIAPLVSSQKHIYYELISNPNKYEEQLSVMTETDLNNMLINPLELVLKNIDLADFVPMKQKLHDENEQIVLYNTEKEITIDRFVYTKMVEAVRKIHDFKRNNEVPANEQTKMDLIEDAKDEAMLANQKPFQSVLRSLISTLSVKCGQCGNDDIWNMNINRFFYDVKRTGKVQDAELLLKGAYSGFGSLKGIDKTRLDIFGEI